MENFDSARHDERDNRSNEAAELLELLGQMQVEARRSLDDEDRLYRGPLPQALYHATTRENLAGIQNKGLLPSELMEGNRRVVSLSDTVSFALECASVTQGVAMSDLAVVEVTTRGQDRDKFRSYLSLTSREYAEMAGLPLGDTPDVALHEVHFEGESGISPDFLHVLSREEIIQAQREEIV